MNKRLKLLRKNLGLSQKSFADKLYISSDLVSACELGRRNLTERTVMNICNTFDVNEDWLKTGVGEMFNDPTLGFDASDDVKSLAKKILSLTPEQYEAVSKMIDALLPK